VVSSFDFKFLDDNNQDQYQGFDENNLDNG
jgi:hypothetical protein